MVCIALLMPTTHAAGQSSQLLSVQGSALAADLFGDNFFAIKTGVGLELQARYTPSAFSLGGGLQFTHHGDSEAEADGHEGYINLLGVFVDMLRSAG